MHTDRGIVHTYRRPDGIYTITDDHNTLTIQSAETENSPWDPPYGPVTQGLVQKHPRTSSMS